MKKNFFIISFILLFSSDFTKCFASHAVGADLTYQCLGGNNYRFFFTLYRDCHGIAVNSQYTITGTSTCGGHVSIFTNLDSTVEIPRLCSALVTQCTNASSPYIGIEANYYHGDVVLPSVCNYWMFEITPICNRNAAVNNLTPNGSTYCLYVKATLDNATVQCNNSPVFANQPVGFLCADQVQYYQHLLTDPDNDSLSFEMYTPHSDATNDVQYIPGLSGSQPVTYTTDSTQFNTSNGEIRFLADGPQITVVAVRISDYRNGALIGSVERDIQLIFEGCGGITPNPPIASGINGTLVYAAHVCYDSLLTFQILTGDPDADSTFLSWDNAIPGGSLTTIAGLYQTGIFSWHPDSSFINSDPYNFIVTVNDNACPSNSSSSYTFQIYVDSCHATSGIGDLENSILYFSADYSPQSQIINIHYELNKSRAISLSLYDLTGREVKKVSVEKSKYRDIALEVHGLSTGVYILKLDTGDGIVKSLKIATQ